MSLEPEETEMSKAAPKPEIQAYLDALDDSQREIVLALRRIVLAAAPGAEEEIKWGRPVYSKGGMLCYVQAGRSHVTFGLARGAELADPDGVLEGTGKLLRHAKVRTKADIRKDLFAGWVRESAALNAAGAAKGA